MGFLLPSVKIFPLGWRGVRRSWQIPRETHTGRPACAVKPSTTPNPNPQLKTNAQSVTCRWLDISLGMKERKGKFFHIFLSIPMTGWTDLPRTVSLARSVTRYRRQTWARLRASWAVFSWIRLAREANARSLARSRLKLAITES